MIQIHNDLWARIEDFQLDEPGAVFPFSAKLAQENHWSREDARLAITEYKRFIFLGMVAGHAVAPSDEVDQVWHLHLTYTKSYWEKWCGEILGKPFHHYPTRGGCEESNKYADWYRKTLESYRYWFEEEAPKRFWPPVEERFAPNMRFARVNVDRNWILPKPRIPWLGRFRECKDLFLDSILAYRQDIRLLPSVSAFVASLLIPVVLVGCNAVLQTKSPLDFRGPEFLDFFWKIWLLSLVLAVFLRWLLRQPGEQVTRGSDLRPDPYLVATVHGRGVLAGTAAMVSLVHAKVLEADKSGLLKRTSVSPPPDLHPLQKAVLRHVHTSSAARVSNVRLGLAKELRELENQAEAHGLYTAPGYRKLARWIPFAVAFAVPLLGVTKIIVGIDRDKPVGFLVMLTIVAALVALFGFLRDPYRSRRGGVWLSRLARRNKKLKSRLSGSDQSAQLALAVALFGTPILASLGHDVLKQAFTPRGGSSSSGGCGGACGGGGDSGGCSGGGGCGGCGGGD